MEHLPELMGIITIETLNPEPLLSGGRIRVQGASASEVPRPSKTTRRAPLMLAIGFRVQGLGFRVLAVEL